jgi:hypothetical protein
MNSKSNPISKLELVSVHFAKAGGTSLAQALSCHYLDQVFWDNSHDPCNEAHNVFEQPILPPTIRAVHGHMRSDRYVKYSPRVLATFLREPVDKLISVYFFWKSLAPSGNPDHARFLAEKPSPEEYALETAGVAFKAYFGDFDMRNFDLIGFHEDRERDLGLLEAMVGFPIPASIHLNETPRSCERSKALRDPALRASLSKILSDDIEFYDYCRHLRAAQA